RSTRRPGCSARSAPRRHGRRRPTVRRRERRLIAILAVAIAIGALAPSALSAPRSGGQGTPAKEKAKSPKGSQAQTQTQPPPQLTEPEEVSASTLAKALGGSGQVDPVAGLGIRNPVCDQLGQIRSRTTRLSCEANGSPESDYPTSNYGFDTFIS